ncbi:MAG: hypothetical protein QOK43_3392 [Acidimicrobiaceae bacterium]|jgi:hypothetical protein|nr:hypothetical protein [Acidimicrobiaceae bacterium]
MLVSMEKGELIMSERDEVQRRQPSSGLLMTVEEVAVLWFGAVGEHGSASANCQKIRRLIPEQLPARRIGNRWYVSRVAAEAWAEGGDSALVMAHPDTREAMARSQGEVA